MKGYVVYINKMFILTLCLLIVEMESKPNILLIMIDDLRTALGVYGDKNAFTPNIDRLAARSIVFQHAYAQQALCAPSRNSLLTTRRPDTLRLYDFYSYWRDVAGNFTTLPQHFRENGYHTHSIGKIFHPGISSNFSDDAIFSWSQNPYHPSTEEYKESKVCLTARGELARNLLCPVIVDEQPQGILPDMQSLNAALEFLQKHHKTDSNEKQPYFLAVGFHKPHVPLKYPIEYLRHHPLENVSLPANHQRPSLLPTVAWNPWTDVRNRDDIAALNISFPFGPMPNDTTAQIIQNYNAAVTYIDDLIGKLLPAVDNNTIIVLTADHGWSMGEHGEFSKFSNFEVAVHVPLIIHVPKLMKNTQPLFYEGLAELVDVFPTLVDLTAVTASLPSCPADSSAIQLCTQGQSLVPFIVNTVQNKTSDIEKPAVFNQYPRPGPFPTASPNSDKPHLKNIRIMGYSVRTPQHRYTEWVRFDNEHFKADWTYTYGIELYDHFLDPHEDMNLAQLNQLQNITTQLGYLLRNHFN